MGTERPLHLAVELRRPSDHPAAGRSTGPSTEAGADADAVDRIVEQVRTAERGGLDLVVFDDTFAPEPAHAPGSPGRLDALLTAARVAPVTAAIGLVATVDVTHTEPFHVSKNVATLDLVSGGRAGWRLHLSTGDAEARLFGRKPAAPLDELVAEADDVAEVVARLWDSWEDGAVIRNRTTGRYVDRDRLHTVDFEGRWFSVRGPSITPRPPQGQPIVMVDAASRGLVDLAARRADVALVEAPDATSAATARSDLRRRAEAAGRDPDHLLVLAVAHVLLEPNPATARIERTRLDQHPATEGTPDTRNEAERTRLDRHPGTWDTEVDGAGAERAQLDRQAGTGNGGGSRAGAVEFVGVPGDLVELVAGWVDGGAADGFLLRPSRLPRDLDLVVEHVVPGLQARGLRPDGAEGRTLRERLGLPRPANRYAGSPG